MRANLIEAKRDIVPHCPADRALLATSILMRPCSSTHSSLSAISDHRAAASAALALTLGSMDRSASTWAEAALRRYDSRRYDIGGVLTNVRQ
jgi:hypothetical protein